MKYTLSEHNRILCEDAVHTKSTARHICVQRAYWDKWGKAHVDPNSVTAATLSAAGLAAVIRHAKPLIRPEELIVGYNFGDGAYEGESWNVPQDEETWSLNGFTAEQLAWWQAPTVPIPVVPRREIVEHLTDKERQMQADFAALNSAGNCSITFNHTVIGYEKVVKMGFSGILEEVERYAAHNGDSPFYESLRMICHAGCVFGENYAAEAEVQGREDIAAVCRQVPRYGARTFREAVQSVWFAHIINTWEDDINANSVGRLDQILYPYYRHDRDAGLLTDREAFDLICALWLKLYRDYDVQQSCVGGRKPDGTSAVNELSYMMLDATEALGFVRCLSVRFDQHTEKAFVSRALEVVGHLQKGIPFFFNDEVMIPALEKAGIAHEDACDYTQIGCVETVIPGKSNPHAVNSRCNLLKALEYTLGNGHSLRDVALCPGLELGDPTALVNFDALMEAVKAQIRHLLQGAVNIAMTYMPSSEVNDPKPYKSLLTEGCVEFGRDFNARGATYDFYQMMFVGVPNLADSLAAVRKLVYEDKAYTMSELITALRADWVGYEPMRLDFLRKAPKFGNDLEEVDMLTRDIIDFACDCLEAESARVGYSFHAQPFTYLWMIEHGMFSSASPDGRRCGEILAYSLSPMQGRDANGLTALLNSIAGLPTKRTPGTTSAIVEVDPKLFTDEHIPYLTDILLTAAARGLSNVQFNTVNVETLLDAREHPENHRNLAVRVSGFSQKFNLLNPTVQDHIIARTKHAQL